ncbi:MAG: DUF1579 family protein [Gemmatimonadetes bacterium]|nr:DUF1579 family protein [Gemmatimonadota bacterium]
MTGNFSDGGRMVMAGEYQDPYTKKVMKLKGITTILSDTEQLYEMYFVNEDGSEWKTMEIKYTKRMANVKAIPEGYQTVTPHLVVNGAAAAIEFYKKAFGAVETGAASDRANRAGAKVLYPLEDAFWGDRYGIVQDPFGHRWSLATHKEDVTSAEIAERAKKLFGG